MYVVVISWPKDKDRGIEPYGPFADEQDQERFIKDCQEAASLGHPLLREAHFLMTDMPPPFDPGDGMPDSARTRYPVSVPARPGSPQ